MKSLNYRTEKPLENNLKLGRKAQLKKAIVKSQNQNIRNNKEIISQETKQEIIMSAKTGNFQDIKPKNLSQFLLQTILKVYFLGLWKRKTKALKYYSRNFNPQRMNFKQLISKISNTIKQHKYEYMKKLFENMGNLPMPNGVIHDANYGTIKIINKETLFKKYSGIIVSLAEVNYIKKIQNIKIILVQVFKAMANSKKTNAQINRRNLPHFPDNTCTYVSKNNKVTVYQKYSQENEKKQKKNLSPQIQNSPYVFGKDIYNNNLSHDFNKSNRKYIYSSIENKGGYIYNNDIYNKNKNITNINSNRVLNMNQQNKNRNEYISSNDIYNNNRRIINSIKKNVIPQSKFNQYISKNDIYNKDLINTSHIKNYSFNNINKYNNNLNRDIQNKSKIFDSKTKYTEYIKNQSLDNNKSIRISKNVLPHKIVKDVNNYISKKKAVNQNINNSIRRSNNYNFLEIKVKKNTSNENKNNYNSNRQINNKNYYNTYNINNGIRNNSIDINNNNSSSYVYNGSLYYNINRQKDKSNDYKSYFKKNYENEGKFNKINYNNLNNKRYNNYEIKSSNNNYNNYNYIPNNYNTINYTDNDFNDYKYNTYFADSNLYDNYNINRNYIYKKSSYGDNNFFNNGGYSGYYIYDNNNFQKGNNKRNNSYENNNEMTYQFYNGYYPVVIEVKSQYYKPKINQNKTVKGVIAYGKQIPVKTNSIKRSKIYNKKQLRRDNLYYNYIYDNANLDSGYDYYS